MSIRSKSIEFLLRTAAAMLLPLLAWSCQWDYDCDGETDSSSSAQYINVTISVSAGNSHAARSPLGGEYGDGTEQGIDDRENKINDITLIFYQDVSNPTNTANLDINTTSDDAKVVCVKKYAVRPFDATNDLPGSHTHKATEPTANNNEYYGQEVLYTTGNQKLKETTLEIGQTYKMLVVANANVTAAPGDKIKTIRDNVLSTIYTGSGLGIDASNFVMSSEIDDATVTLENPSIDTSDGENKMIFYFNCIHIERLAARIDYCTKGSEYVEYTSNDQGPAGAEKSYKGYKYVIDANNFMVVTKVTPFNLYNENEYLFKRVRENWTDATPAINYLGDETTDNYVVDPNTAGKTGATFSYLNLLTSMVGAGGPGGGPAGGQGAGDNTNYSQVMADVHSTNSILDSQGFNNIIIGYPRENTLNPQSTLKTYATGIAFETKWYRNNEPPRTRTYYHYLRHQGEEDTGIYQAKELKRDILNNDNDVCGSSPAMKYGVVRNNIYRVSIKNPNAQEGTIMIKIEEEKWRHVDNPTIYL